MSKTIRTILCAVMLMTALGSSVSARDRLAHGYSSASGVFAGLWVAQEGKLFEKYDIDSLLILNASGSMLVQAMLGGDLLLVAAVHGGLEAAEVRLDRRRVVAVLEPLTLGTVVALDL